MANKLLQALLCAAVCNVSSLGVIIDNTPLLPQEHELLVKAPQEQLVEVDEWEGNNIWHEADHLIYGETPYSIACAICMAIPFLGRMLYDSLEYRLFWYGSLALHGSICLLIDYLLEIYDPGNTPDKLLTIMMGVASYCLMGGVSPDLLVSPERREMPLIKYGSGLVALTPWIMRYVYFPSDNMRACLA